MARNGSSRGQPSSDPSAAVGLGEIPGSLPKKSHDFPETSLAVAPILGPPVVADDRTRPLPSRHTGDRPAATCAPMGARRRTGEKQASRPGGVCRSDDDHRCQRPAGVRGRAATADPRRASLGEGRLRRRHRSEDQDQPRRIGDHRRQHRRPVADRRRQVHGAAGCAVSVAHALRSGRRERRLRRAGLHRWRGLRGAHVRSGTGLHRCRPRSRPLRGQPDGISDRS